MMIILSIILLIATGAILYYALFLKNTDQYTRLEDIYKEKYYRDETKLRVSLRKGEITQDQFDEEMIHLGRDLLAVAADGKPANTSVRWTLIIGMLIIAAGALLTFWSYGYDALVQKYDQERMAIKPVVKKWVDGIALNDLRADVAIEDLHPPKEIIDSSTDTFMALNMLSSRVNHTNLKYLYLLGNIYYQRALYFLEDPKYHELGRTQLQVANDIYINLYEKEDIHYKSYANNMFLYMQLAMNDFILDERLEYNYDRLIQMNPHNDSMKLQYVYILVENGKYEKALLFVHELQNSYKGEGEEQSLQALTMMAEQIELLKSAKDAIYRVTGQFTLDESMSNLPDSATLFVYLREKGQLSGPPLAAKKVSLKSAQWPLRVELTDSEILIDSGKKLEEYDDLEISARISLTGDPLPKHGDIEAKAKPVVKGEMIQLHFDQRRIEQ